jgi:hypothetical protein
MKLSRERVSPQVCHTAVISGSARMLCVRRGKEEWRKRDLIATWLLEGEGNRRITIYGFLEDSE